LLPGLVLDYCRIIYRVLGVRLTAYYGQGLIFQAGNTPDFLLRASQLHENTGKFRRRFGFSLAFGVGWWQKVSVEDSIQTLQEARKHISELRDFAVR
jgi:hypothetical protein